MFLANVRNVSLVAGSVDTVKLKNLLLSVLVCLVVGLFLIELIKLLAISLPILKPSERACLRMDA